MDIKWSYYLIAVIYILVIVLRLINNTRVSKFKADHQDCIQVFAIKKDFFTTVSVICILVTLAINIAALCGSRPLNTNSMVVTVLVIGFTVINSFSNIILSEASKEMLFCGYTLAKGDIENVKVKTHNVRYAFSINFNKEIDSYNYAKIVAFGANKEALKNMLNELV